MPNKMITICPAMMISSDGWRTDYFISRLLLKAYYFLEAILQIPTPLIISIQTKRLHHLHVLYVT